MNEAGAKLVAKEMGMRATRAGKGDQFKYEVAPFDTHGDRVLTWGVKQYVKNQGEWFFDKFVEW